MGPSCWTTLSTRDLAGQLSGLGHQVSYRTVRLLLRDQGFVLRGNAKVLEGAQHPDRDAQFRHIDDTAAEFLDAGDPVVSIDAKKKEMVGDFPNPGRTWHPAHAPVKVKDHTFANQAQAIAIPFGVYDLGANSGWVSVGIDHNTAAFAVEGIRRWWRDTGTHRYGDAGRLLLCADAGRPNASGSWMFKAELAQLAEETGLDITVAHYPPGTSKWNKIEHRLFSAISMNWRGMPLTSLRVVVEAIAATTNASGLTVRAELDEGLYPIGRETSKTQREALPLHRHDWHGDWNYTLRHVTGFHLPPLIDRPRRGPRPARPDTTWLQQPAVTGMPAPTWAALVAALQDDIPAPRGAPPVLTPAERLLATIFKHRHGWPHTQIAELMRTGPDTVSRYIGATTTWLEANGHELPHPTPLPTAADITTALQQTSTT